MLTLELDQQKQKVRGAIAVRRTNSSTSTVRQSKNEKPTGKESHFIVNTESQIDFGLWWVKGRGGGGAGEGRVGEKASRLKSDTEWLDFFLLIASLLFFDKRVKNTSDSPGYASEWRFFALTSRILRSPIDFLDARQPRILL